MLVQEESLRKIFHLNHANRIANQRFTRSLILYSFYFMINRLGVKSDNAEIEGSALSRPTPTLGFGSAVCGLRLGVESAHANPRDHNGWHEVWAETRRLVGPRRV